MTWQEIYNEVVSLTNHPEMVAETTSAIKAATLRNHQRDYFARDIAEAQIILPSSDFYQQFDIFATFPRFRAIKWLRKYDPAGQDPLSLANTGASGAFFKILDPDAVIDGYGIHKPNIAYIAGRNLNLRSDTTVRFLLAAWYQNPLILSTNYSSWIAEQVPYAIIFDAVSLIFQTLGHQDQSRKYDALCQEQFHMVTMTGLDAKGY